MAGYGVRVFELSVMRGGRAGIALPVEDPLGDGVSQYERIVNALTVLSQPSPRTLTTVPSLRDIARWEPPTTVAQRDPRIWIESFETTLDGHVLVRLKHGLHGEYPEARGEDVAVDLSDKAPNRDFRALFLLPASGTEARLVVEAINRRCPVTMLLHWLAKADFERSPGAWTSMRAYQLSDRDKLKKMIRDSEKFEVRLKESRPATPGRRRGTRKTLSVEVESELQRHSLIAAVSDLIEHGADHEYVEKVERIAGLDPAELDQARLEFDGASVVVTDPETGRPKTIDPDRIREWFTYEIAPSPPTDDSDWIGLVRDLLGETLLEGTDIQV
ncbi:hypothetical protein [Cellulosimicrobium sp. 22601]|uniref:hypothetical protein n=1 Tax=unclassified Cellulosimicrobium TaxID=2624466 RepID=UPI003F87E119